VNCKHCKNRKIRYNQGDYIIKINIMCEEAEKGRFSVIADKVFNSTPVQVGAMLAVAGLIVFHNLETATVANSKGLPQRFARVAGRTIDSVLGNN
jgi:hypothetical protein